MSFDAAPSRYRRRRRWPILIVLVVLVVGAGIVWARALRPAPAEATGCNQPVSVPASALPTSRVRTTTGAGGPTGTGDRKSVV